MPVPGKWLDYKPYGTIINGTRLLPFKAPLNEALCGYLEKDKQFTPAMLLKEFPRLKYVIDLTNSYRFYDKKLLTDAGVRYEKIMAPGHQIPPMAVIEKFIKVMEILTSMCGEDDIVGVHCTHGLNRTGYLICRYLIQQLGWKHDDAIKAFEEARGHPMRREAYIIDLKKAPCGQKINTIKVVLDISLSRESPRRPLRPPPCEPSGFRPRPMGPPSGFGSARHGFAADGPFPPMHFGFGGPPQRIRSIASGPGMPPMPPPPPPGPLQMYGPRPFRYGPPQPPRPGFLIPGFPPKSLPNRTPRLLPISPARLPPPPPLALTPRPAVKRLQPHKRKQHLCNGASTSMRSRGGLIRRDGQRSRILPKPLREPDFTADTFEENLLAVVSGESVANTAGKEGFSQNK